MYIISKKNIFHIKMNEKRTKNSKKVNKGIKNGFNPLSQNKPEKNHKTKKRMKLK